MFHINEKRVYFPLTRTELRTEKKSIFSPTAKSVTSISVKAICTDICVHAQGCLWSFYGQLVEHCPIKATAVWSAPIHVSFLRWTHCPTIQATKSFIAALLSGEKLKFQLAGTRVCCGCAKALLSISAKGHTSQLSRGGEDFLNGCWAFLLHPCSLLRQFLSSYLLLSSLFTKGFNTIKNWTKCSTLNA